MITPRKIWNMLTCPRPFHKALVAINSAIAFCDEARGGASQFPPEIIAQVRGSYLGDQRCEPETYHMGSRVAEGKSRLMYTASFVSAPSMFPRFSNHIVTSNELSQTESVLLRM